MQNSVSEALDILRTSLYSIDRSIVDLVAARMQVAKIIGSTKARLGTPVYDEKREVVVSNMLVEEARRLGLPAELVRTIYRELARWSRCQQVYCPVKARIAVYGYGSMAHMLVSLLARAGCWVAVTGRSEEKAARLAEEVGVEVMGVREAIDWADMMIYAIPTQPLIELLRQHWPLYRGSMLITDITSVKKPVVEVVEKLVRERGEDSPDYASLHPLFGPLECPSGETIAVVPVKLELWKSKLEKLLVNGLGFRLVYTTADEHDKAMAVNQVLHHLALELYAKAREKLAEKLGIPKHLVKELSTRSLKQTLTTWERLETMYKVVEEIRMENPYTREAVMVLEETLNEILKG